MYKTRVSPKLFSGSTMEYWWDVHIPAVLFMKALKTHIHIKITVTRKIIAITHSVYTRKSGTNPQHKSTVQTVDKGLLWTMRARLYCDNCLPLWLVSLKYTMHWYKIMYLCSWQCDCLFKSFMLNYVREMTFVKGNKGSTIILNDGAIPNLSQSQNAHMIYQNIMWWNMFHIHVWV